MKNLILLLLLPLTMLGQGNIAVNVAQDLRLATMGDNNGNEAFTPNFIARVDLQDNQRTYGYYVGGVEYEYADLQLLYQRFSLNFGYTFNQFKVLNNDKFELTILANYGMTIRELNRTPDIVNGVTINDRKVNAAFTGFAGSMTLSYPITNSLRAVAIGQLSHRVDKNTLYGNDARYTIDGLHIDASGFIGLQYTIKLKPIR